MAAPAQQGQDFAGIGKSPSLTMSLERAHRLAVERGHGIVTLEHLLLSLTEDGDAAAVFGVSPLNVGQLRGDLGEVLKRVPPPDVQGRAILPNADLLRVLRLAATAAQQSQRPAIDGMIVLAAIIGDGKTAGAQLLTKHGLTFNEVIRVLQSSSMPRPQSAAPEGPRQIETPVATARAAVALPQAPVVQTPPVQQGALQQSPAQQPAAPSASDGRASGAVQSSVLPRTEAAAPSRVQSTDELLASVRARLKDTVPPLRELPPVSAPSAQIAPPPAPALQAAPPPPQPPSLPMPEPPRAAGGMAADALAPVVAKAAEGPKPAALPPLGSPPQSLSAIELDAGSDIGPFEYSSELPPVASPAPVEAQPVATRMPPRLNPAPLPMPRRDNGRPDGEHAEGVDPAALQSDAGLPAANRSRPPTLPPPMLPPSGDTPPVSSAPPAPGSVTAPPRSGPPPLPSVAPSAPREQTSPPAQAQGGMPSSPQVTPQGQQPPQPSGQPPVQSMAPQIVLPLPTIDLAALADGLPEMLRKGQATVVEVAIPRRVFELGHAMPPLRPGYWPPVRVVSLRLAGQGDTVVIEPMTPTSLWVRIWRGPSDPENLTWRWRVLAQRTGAIGLSLSLGARTVGPEGVGQEALWPEEVVGVRVKASRARRFLVGTVFIVSLLLGAAAAIFYSGKSDLVLKPVLSLWQSVRGK